VASVAELMERMLQDVFNEPDPARRDAAIAETFTEDVVFRDAEGTVAGRAALAAKVTELLAQGPGFVFVHDGPLREIPETLGVRAWRLGHPAEARCSAAWTSPWSATGSSRRSTACSTATRADRDHGRSMISMQVRRAPRPRRA
jgi:hypothetical protein